LYQIKKTVRMMSNRKPHILFLFSDTGGGHRSASEAIIEAIHLQYGDHISTEMVDFFKEYGPPPLNQLPELYPKMVRLPRAWGLGYRISNGQRRARLLSASAWPYVRKSLQQLNVKHPCNLIVSVHPMANELILRALGPERPHFITVVTDMVTTHAFWYHHQVDLCIVPTEAARQRAMDCGLEPNRVRVVGLPVANRFCLPIDDPKKLRARYGWPSDRTLVLLVGGGEGMGPLEETARAIAKSCPQVALVVIAGRNTQLITRLKRIDWPLPTFIYGFVREMPEFMQAADILVTKAGPGTISEAFIAGLPMVLYSRLPGQEDGNVTYVISEGAGIWAPQPGKIVQAVKHWLKNPQEYQQAVSACKRLARPDASRQIAQILVENIKVKNSKKTYE
jgi:1,2-diacylglycerol 3-beta-galactosyltransferase